MSAAFLEGLSGVDDGCRGREPDRGAGAGCHGRRQHEAVRAQGGAGTRRCGHEAVESASGQPGAAVASDRARAPQLRPTARGRRRRVLASALDHDPRAAGQTMLPAAGVSTWLVDSGFWTDRLCPPRQLARWSWRVGSPARCCDWSRWPKPCSQKEFPDRPGRRSSALGWPPPARPWSPRRPSRRTGAAWTSTGRDPRMRRSAGPPRRCPVPRRCGSTTPRSSRSARITADANLPCRSTSDWATGTWTCSRRPAAPGALAAGATDRPDRPAALLPYHRAAGYLAEAFGHVYLDVGLAINHLSVRSVELVGRVTGTRPLPSSSTPPTPAAAGAAPGRRHAVAPRDGGRRAGGCARVTGRRPTRPGSADDRVRQRRRVYRLPADGPSWAT